MALQPRTIVRCQHCDGQADLPVDALAVHAHPSGHTVAFSCPACGARDVRAVTRAEADIVQSMHQRAAVAGPMVAASSAVPALTGDDAGDFRDLLAATDAVAELARHAG